MRRRTIAIAAAVIAAQALGPVSPALAAEPATVTYEDMGVEQIFDVPVGVTSIHVVLIGASGGSINQCGAGGLCGGRGARVEGDLAVVPGTRLYVEVGGSGGNADLVQPTAGFNGGGWGGLAEDIGAYAASGGGASDVRTSPRAQFGSLDSRLMVAGGGGGASGGTIGGDAGAPGGGGIFGGGAGSPSSGGAAGSGGGSVGGLGIGGSGADGIAAAGGGGGGGQYGGGGGGVDNATTTDGGGGGGSSSTGGATNATVATDNTRTPSVTISYGTALPSSGTIDAIVTMAGSAVCLELSTTTIDFGTRQFGEIGALATPAIGITNCGGVTETILARGTDATGAGPSTWSLLETGSCVDGTLSIDEYRLGLVDPNSFDQTPLTTINQALQTLDGGLTINRTAFMDTACPGSSGAGVVMAMQIVFVATE